MAGVLVLDNTWRAVDFISPERAITLCLLDKATVVVEHETKVFRSQFLTINIPKVISLKVYVPLSRQVTDNVTRDLLLARDNYTCQYCGKDRKTLPKGEPLTKDHVKPISQFPGKTRSDRLKLADTWDNVALSCYSCNTKKNNRTPEEAGMVLLCVPKKPIGIIYNLVGKVDDEQKQFITTY